MSRLNPLRILVLLVILLVIISCSKGKDPVTPDNPEISGNQSAQTYDSNHCLLGYWTIKADFEANEFEMVPVRNVSKHYNILHYIQSGIFYGLTVDHDGMTSIDFHILCTYTDPYFTFFDMRGIVMMPGTKVFGTAPADNKYVSDQSLGDFEVTNADGYTALYNNTIDRPFPPYQGYIEGDYATLRLGTKTATVNAYKMFNSSEPGTYRNAFLLIEGDIYTQCFEINPPMALPGDFEFGYAIDANWEVGSPPYEIDDFPITANCPEPWKIEVTEESVGTGLRPHGGSTTLLIDVYEHVNQGGTHSAPIVECPDLFNGEIVADFISQTNDICHYEANIVNNVGAECGEYMCLISVEDYANDPIDKPWLDLTAYQICKLNVRQPELWYYTQANFANHSELPIAIDVLEGAHSLGYSKVVVSNANLNNLDDVYLDRFELFCNAANNLEPPIDVIPSMAPIGHSEGLIKHHRAFNLNEGQYVEGCEFKVDQPDPNEFGTAKVVQDSNLKFINNGFEDGLSGWNSIGSVFPDTTGGISSAKFIIVSNMGGSIHQEITVEEQQCYLITFQYKCSEHTAPTEGLINTLRVQVIDSDALPNRLIRLNEQGRWMGETGDDWKSFHAIFNSQDIRNVRITIGVENGAGADYYIDDITITNAGLSYCIDRGDLSTPITVQPDDPNLSPYIEGLDYFVVFEVPSQPPQAIDPEITHVELCIPPSSNISHNEIILVDYYHANWSFGSQTAFCLTADEPYDWIKEVMLEFSPFRGSYTFDNIFIGIDELRIAHNCNRCREYDDAGKLLEYVARRIKRMAHEVNPNWELIVWNDMFDPEHNAHDNYWMVGSTLEGSWRGLIPNGSQVYEKPPWIVANWYHVKDNDCQSIKNSFSHFGGNDAQELGLEQVICGYYDYDTEDYTGVELATIKDLIDAAISEDVPIRAIMYTTWRGDYDYEPVNGKWTKWTDRLTTCLDDNW